MPQADLPREVLVWIQGLDLSYAVKSVKRDFANGFLVAEIFSRYFPQNVRMSAFQNGTGKQCKTINWHQLELLFKKWEVPFDRELINEVIHCKKDACVTFLEFIYEFLNGRKVKRDIIARTESKYDTPVYARPTASNAIRTYLKQPGMQAISDERTRESKTLEVLSHHNAELHSRRLASISTRSNTNSTAGVSRESEMNSLCQDSSRNIQKNRNRIVESESKQTPQVVVQEVQVKQITKDVANLRASRALNASPQTLNSPNLDGMSMLRKGDSTTSGSSSSPSSQAELLTLLNNAVISTVIEQEHIEILRQLESQPIFAFIQVIQKQEWFNKPLLPDALSSNVFKEISKKIEASNIAVDENAFWLLSCIMIPAMSTTPEATDTFESCKEAFVKYGMSVAASQPEESTKLILKVGLPKLVNIIKMNPGKRHGVLRVLYSFVPVNSSSHISVIKSLYDQLNDTSYFIHCLTILIFMEEGFEYDDDDTLLDLYVYYAFTGMAATSPSIRAASIAMLAVIVQFNQEIVVRILPKLRDASRDNWWEIQAQLLIVCSKLLEETPPEVSYEEELIDIALSILNNAPSDNVRKVGFTYLARNLDTHPNLARHYIYSLMRFTKKSYQNSGKFHSGDGPMDCIEKLLQRTDESEELPVASASGGVYHLNSLPTIWDNTFIAQELLNIVEEHELQSLESWHLRIFFAALSGAVYQENSKEIIYSPEWLEIYGRIKDYIFLAICDETALPIALEIIKYWSENSPPENNFSILADPSLEGAIKLLFSHDEMDNRNHACQRGFVDFFKQVLQEESHLSLDAKAMFVRFFKIHPGHLQTTPILGELESLL